MDTANLMRAAYIAKRVKNLLEEKSLQIQDIADKMGVTHAYISQNLGGRKAASDSFFKKTMKAIPLTDIQIKEIFKEADREKYKYKYGEDIDCQETNFKAAFKKKFGKEPTEKDMEILKRIFNGEN